LFFNLKNPHLKTVTDKKLLRRKLHTDDNSEHTLTTMVTRDILIILTQWRY